MKHSKILIIDNNISTQKLLANSFKKEGYETVSVTRDQEGLLSFQKERPDLVISDLKLSRTNGFELCRTIRTEDGNVPILVLTSKKSEVDKIVAFEMGANDYVTKPFSINELMVRIKSLLRHKADGNGSGPRLRCGNLEMDPERYEVWVKNKLLELTSKEFMLLKTLWAARGKVLTRDDILDRVWEMDKAAAVESRTVDQHIARLREKMGSAKKHIKTIKNIGYKFIQVI